MAEEIDRLSQEIQRLSKHASIQKALLDDAAEAALRLNIEPDVLARVLAIREPPIPGMDDETIATLRRLQDSLRRAAKELGEDRHALEMLRSSWSWRLTAPLRGLLDGVRMMFLLLRLDHGLWGKQRLFGLAQWIVFRTLIRNSGLFDQRYYLAANPDGPALLINPLLHFFVFGIEQARKPNSLFDVRYYRESNPDVARSVINPLVHYLKWGAYEGRDPHPQFDSSYYLDRYPDVRQAHVNPLAHFLAPGIIEGRNPNAWFDTSEYLERNPEVAALGLNPLAHYMEHHSHVLGRHSDL